MTRGYRFWDSKRNCYAPNGEFWINYKGEWATNLCSKYLSYKGSDITPEQSTGFFYKNGKEIYEGDIIQVHHVRLVSDGPVHKPRVAEIKWLDDDCGFRLVGAEVRSTNPVIYPTSHLEVIGNIHENPELLA